MRRIFALIGYSSLSMKRGASLSSESVTRAKKVAPSKPTSLSASGDGPSAGPASARMFINQTSADFEVLESPQKSENDKKDYRVIKLKNGLRALLISKPAEESPDDESVVSDVQSDAPMSGGSEAGSGIDEDEDRDEATHQSAASLTIGVGSFSDPEDVPGLAHFLEHMVFMGSEKFPQENDFDSFIKKQGGEDNASTDWDVTTFYFVSQTPGFKDALDRFAQFFISPLLKKEAMQREREAVESEFNLALPSDYHRKKQLITSLAKKGHPATKFSWGNIASLGGAASGDQEKRDSEVHARLQAFREQHYTAETMTLALQSTHDLDTMQQWVLEFFSHVPIKDATKHKPQAADESLKLPFDTNEFKMLYRVEPVKDIREVVLTWSLPSLLDKYMTKPDRYVSWVLGYEGKGSLIQYLRKRVWALELYSGSDDTGADHNSHYLHFSITVALTEDGYKHLDEVLHAIFSYMNLMRQKGPQERIFRELQQIQETKFRFSPEPSPGDNVEDLSDNMQKFPPKYYLSGSELFFEYDPKGISEVLSQMRHDNVNLMVLNSDFKGEYQNKENWFKTPYNVEEIPKNWTMDWESALPLDSFHLPEANPYITTDFQVFEPESIGVEYPQNIVKSKLGELWFKQDTKFNLPRAYIIFQLVSPIIFLSPQNACMLDLMISGWKQILTAQVYPAEVAELSYSINPSEAGTGQGISIQVAGYNQNLPLLLENILKEWVKLEDELSEDLFLAIKDVMKKEYYNIALKPSKLLKDVHNSITKSTHWTVVEKYDAIDDITFDQLKSYSRQLKQRLFCRMLIQGNMLKGQAIKVMDSVQQILKFKPLISNTWPQMRMSQLPVGETFMQVESVNKNSSNSAVSQTFYAGLGKMREICVAEVVMLMLEEAAFDFLRTKETLGYSVGTSISIAKGVLRFSVSVHNQEDKNTVGHVDSKIQEFLVKFYDDLKKMSSEELEELRTSAMRQKKQADLQLKEEVDRNWEEVYTDEHIFNRRQIEHDIIANITHEEMVEWFNKFVFDGDHKRILNLAVRGITAAPEASSQEVDASCSHEEMCLKVLGIGDVKRNLSLVQDITEFKRSLFYYPNHKVLD